GTILSDFGDLVRSSICSANEDETDLSKIEINADFLTAIHKGYLAALSDELTENELNALPFAGPMLVYMQALRFLTDYLNSDCYYSIRYPEHNFDRAMNQYVLLTRLLAEPYCKSIRN
ncbi:MAG: aminoglycoside phosphotransferase, partial [Ignavibacteria bacterium]|nr:aminoglycoside phosphotransferase [Ignavibacteria bacterium]